MEKNEKKEEAIFQANMDNALERITLELNELKANVKEGKQLSLGKIRFFSGMLTAFSEGAGSW